VDYCVWVLLAMGLNVVREPSFQVRVPGTEGRRPDLLLREWEGGKDLFVDVVGSSSLAASNLGRSVPGGPSIRAVVRNEASYRNVLRAQPPSIKYVSFAFEFLGVLDEDTLGLLGRLQGGVNLSALNHDACVWFSVVRLVSFAIAKAVGRQLSSRLPCWGGPSGR
jgi:hypothetical protein